MGNRSFSAVVLAALVSATLAAQSPPSAAPAQNPDATQRATERIRGLQRESEALASQERSLLVDLRKLEVERELRSAELARAERGLTDTRAQIQATAERAAKLRSAADAERPDVEARLVQIYKMGRAGYWRMLLSVDDFRAVGRAYRTAAALTHIDRERVQQYARTIDALEVERRTLQARAGDQTRLQQQAKNARAAIDRAVGAHNALIGSIDARRDLNAQLTGELEAAARKLQATVTELGPAAAGNMSLPIRPFRGVLPWPADGIVVGRFGQYSVRSGGTRNGIDVSLAEGQPVLAVHEGTVAFAGQFTGYGNLVILDHGEGAYSLYGHLSSLAVSRGERVQARRTLGASGRNPSGNPSLYFELRVDGKPVDPLQWLKKQP